MTTRMLTSSLNAMTCLLLAALGLLFFSVFFLEDEGIEEKEPQIICGVLPPDYTEGTSAGKALFKANCAQCHNKSMKDNLTGPALAGTEERWADFPRTDLYDWIRNSQKMIADGHPRAAKLWEEGKPTVMTAFPNLSDEDIENILDYIEAISEGNYFAVQ